jgi:DNA-binding GntR family transcriptional regulator
MFVLRPPSALTTRAMPPHAPPVPADPTEADRRLRAAVLDHLLGLYPAWLTEVELASAVGEAQEPCARAVRDLAADGLVHRRGTFVLPTRAAVCSAALLSDAPARPC